VPESVATDRGAGRRVVATCLSAALMPLNSTMIAVAVPNIARDFDSRPGSVTQALVATYLVAAIALQSAGGKLGDRIGHWRVFGFGQLLIGVGALLGCLAPDLWLLVCSRVLMAGGGALVVPATLAVLRVELPGERRGRAFGTFGAVMSLAAGIGPIVGGEMVSAFGWRSVFVANLPVLVASALLVPAGRRRRPDDLGSAPFDWRGAAVLTALLAAAVCAVQAHGITALALGVAGALLVLPFVWLERRAADPVIAFSLFRSARFTMGSLVIALLNLVMYALLFEIPLLTARLFHLGSAATGRLLVFMMLAMVATSLVAGRLVDSYGSRPVALVGVLVCIGGVTLMLADSPATSGDLRLPLLLLGAGVGLANPAAQNASLGSVPDARSGMAAGVGSSMRYLGGIAGVAVLGRTLHLGGSRADVLATHRIALAVFLAVLIACLACAALTDPVRAARPAARRRPAPADAPRQSTAAQSPIPEAPAAPPDRASRP
jgi:MFS family permease